MRRLRLVAWAWARSSGRGRVFTWTVAAAPCTRRSSDVPYAPVVVEMEEGVRVLTCAASTARPTELAIDMPVEVVFDAVTAEVTLPRFRRRG